MEKHWSLIIVSDTTQLKSMLSGVPGDLVTKTKSIYQANHWISFLLFNFPLDKP